ncbi:hypothetical protein D3C71_1193730 [compost metagenome]
MLKKSLSFLLVCSCFLLLFGCGSDGSAEIESLKKDNQFLESTVEQLKLKIENATVTEVAKESSLKIVDGAPIGFETINGKITFPNAIKLPDSKDDVNNSYVMVGSRFKYTPSSNWVFKMNGTTLELYHPASKINGSIKSIATKEGLRDEAIMKQILQNFYTGFPTTTISYKRLYMDEYVVGLLSYAKITVDSKPMTAIAGFLTRGEYAQLYLFAYADDGGVQEELVNLLIASGTLGDVKIKIE